MRVCPSCSGEVADGSRFCPSCGEPLETPTSAPTETSLESESTAASVPTPDQSRFLPGTVLAKRYRMVSLLGRGGMGEVYRADDLKLGQPVALKFLPADVQRDRTRLDRFLNEVKTALKVTHPNVCRVYDIGEVDGQHYLAMEYVDGEDLASLLRRIGRLPQDKAVQIARQLSAGLAAAHEEGILHRDLKPANVMIDGRGRAKITDFGLAGLAEGIQGDEVRAGTPMYMAPEQHAGKEVTVRSDIYSLGLVYYELFTGKRAFEAATPAEMLRLQQKSLPTSPSSHVEGLDATIERAILRCLERDPASRPASAMAVGAALPGGDPLAAAMAAGETPSPEMVANAGDLGGLSPVVGFGLFLVLAIGMIGFGLYLARYHLVVRVGMKKSPQVLVVEARQIVEKLGYTDPPTDVAHGIYLDREYLEHRRRDYSAATRWEALETVRPAPIRFFYRQSSRVLVPENALGSVTASNPPVHLSGMVNVALDARGRLVNLLAVPPQVDDSSGPWPEPDWSILLEAAGLGASNLTETRPTWNPLVSSDSRAAWEGAYSGQDDIPIRVEAAAYHGKPVWFDVIPPWKRPTRMVEPEQVQGEAFIVVIGIVILIGVVIGGGLLTRRNVRLGRADRRGALRLAAFVFVLFFLGLAAVSHHVPAVSEVAILWMTASMALAMSSLYWLTYMALEPYARRLWPEAMISWSRLLDGRLRDPRIGRDILVGGAAVIGVIALQFLYYVLADLLFGWKPGQIVEYWAGMEQGGVLGDLCRSVVGSIMLPLLMLLLVLLVQVILRKQWIAVIVIFGVLVAGDAAVAGTPVALPAVVLGAGLFLYVLFRFGLLAAVSFAFFSGLLRMSPLVTDLSLFYVGPSLVVMIFAMAVAFYAFWISRAGRPLFRDAFMEPIK